MKNSQDNGDSGSHALVPLNAKQPVTKSRDSERTAAAAIREPAASLQAAHDLLRWPKPQDIVSPPGSGVRVYADLARQKLGRALADFEGDAFVNVGVLARNPHSRNTEEPIAVVCEFRKPVSQATLKKAQMLAWSFCRMPLLIVIEPTGIRAWSCYQKPNRSDDPRRLNRPVANMPFTLDLFPTFGLSEHAACSLDWLNLVSGRFFKENAARFRPNQRADRLLLQNLALIRDRLIDPSLPLDIDIAHTLLARLIFIQFLFQRVDSDGHPALNEAKLADLNNEGILSRKYTCLQEILSDHQDAYGLFRWLDSKFNGDLFPGTGSSQKAREEEWRAEMHAVQPKHLGLLSDFVSGNVQLDGCQGSLWPLYSFDVIPLEFVSSIYEEFVQKEKGVHYTPNHLVDFMLDSVLPWDGERWDLRILDPACGSGTFLVRAYQRLIHRWKNAHPAPAKLGAVQLRGLLQRCIFGVDTDRHAVRVASFSLYLAMCDEIDPRHYWKRVKFPQLRGRRLIDANFFRDDIPGIRTVEDAGSYDLVIGNAPWGKGGIEEIEQKWAEDHDWPTANKEKGPIFLAKAAALCKPDGHVSMVQPAGALLFNRETTADEQRKAIFTRYKVEAIANLSALRFKLFPTSAGAACVITMRPTKPDGSPITYYTPKRTSLSEDHCRIVIEPYDQNQVYPNQAIDNQAIWTALAWGGRRDLSLLHKLNSFSSLGARAHVVSREGIIRGDRKQPQPTILQRRMLHQSSFPEDTFLLLEPDNLDVNTDVQTDDRASTDFTAFELPQLLVKQSWQRQSGRFQAALVSPHAERGVLCSQSYLSVHVPHDKHLDLEAACLAYNSSVAVYYLLLTSGRIASYIPEGRVGDLLAFPIPESRPGLLAGLTSYGDLDLRVCEAYGLKEAELALIEDLFAYTLPDFQGGMDSPGRRYTDRSDDDKGLREYCEYVCRVLRAGFGDDKGISATIFQDSAENQLPVRLVAIHLDSPGEPSVTTEAIGSDRLREQLLQLNDQYLNSQSGNGGGVFYQRVARMYTLRRMTDQMVPTIYIIKPDQRRYWSRSIALRDADEIAADILLWQDRAMGAINEQT